MLSYLDWHSHFHALYPLHLRSWLFFPFSFFGGLDQDFNILFFFLEGFLLFFLSISLPLERSRFFSLKFHWFFFLLWKKQKEIKRKEEKEKVIYSGELIGWLGLHLNATSNLRPPGSLDRWILGSGPLFHHFRHEQVERFSLSRTRGDIPTLTLFPLYLFWKASHQRIYSQRDGVFGSRT